LFENILVPLDGSEQSKKALEIAAEMAKKFNGKLVLVHVFSLTPKICVVADFPPGAVEKYSNALVESGKRILLDGRSKAEKLGVMVDTLLKEGFPVQEITKISTEGKFGLIVMGTRGLGQIKGMLMGSVSHDVSHRAACPVLLVK
jgi:nucleotide-binding universal stress UspA family protein